jgi:hypothetical protein
MLAADHASPVGLKDNTRTAADACSSCDTLIIPLFSVCV